MNICPHWVSVPGNFPERKLYIVKISKQLENEATAQVKSKLENSNTAYVYALV